MLKHLTSTVHFIKKMKLKNLLKKKALTKKLLSLSVQVLSESVKVLTIAVFILFFLIKKAGIETIIINNNPETVSTDFDTADKLYFEPLTDEDVMGQH